MSDSNTKRKRPPTFQHFPINRAKVLKKQWVEKTKIKSKWKAQKKKEDLFSQSKLELPIYSDDEGSAQNGDAENSERVKEGAEMAPRSTHQHQSHLHPSRAHIHPELPVMRPKENSKRTKRLESEVRPTKKQKFSKEEEDETASQPSVRELMREAYSRSSLHTYKADPFKKRLAGPGSQRDGKSSDHGRPQTGKGQPDMKLRMNAMLAKIKQDCTS
ncbi:hypothetical protein CPB84DRAFT_1842329 [Gymnopilus junonius]|uniref:Uncharacterized protein n=1 Tax=Gymnopilus junonius TaxID=109634 RepID=A0A9P5TTM7_GYMJU|nr:hypothetical protein CPB84DRAFT_1842329 [Gymnopilus junonius]